SSVHESRHAVAVLRLTTQRSAARAHDARMELRRVRAGRLQRLVRPPATVADDGKLEAAQRVCADHGAQPHAGLPSMIVIPVGEGVSIALVSLKPAAL